MNTVIWKYPIEIADVNQIMMKRACKPIYTGIDPNGVPSLWCIVDPDSDDVVREIYIIGTGNPMPKISNLGEHAGSFVHGPFVWHVFMDLT